MHSEKATVLGVLWRRLVGLDPTKLLLEGLWVVSLPVVFELFSPFVVDSGVDVALQ